VSAAAGGGHVHPRNDRKPGPVQQIRAIEITFGQETTLPK